MEFRDFCYWLRGFIEVTEAGLTRKGPFVNEKENLELKPDQINVIKEHLNMCFNREGWSKTTVNLDMAKEIPLVYNHYGSC